MDIAAFEALIDPLSGVVGRNAVGSLLWLIAILASRFFIVRAIMRREFLSSEVRRRWLVSVRNGLVFVFVAGLFFIWAEEIRTLAFSIVAFAVALAIATKELILCALGGILRASVRPFAVGDRIEVNNLRGDVIDQRLLTTTVLEVGPGRTGHEYTGREIVIPNSLLLLSPLVNESFMKDYAPHVFNVPLDADADWQAAEHALLEAGRAECAPFLEGAKRHMRELEIQHGLTAQSVEPHVEIYFPEPGVINLAVTVIVPDRERGRVEQAVLRRFLSMYRMRSGARPRRAAGR